MESIGRKWRERLIALEGFDLESEVRETDG